MSKIPSMTEMLQAGVHFGHKISKRHPKMEPYLYLIRNGVSIIDLEKTAQKLEEALKFIEDTVSKGGTVLFLGTKRQAQSIIKKYALECNMPYVTERWLGGTITNFGVISKLIRKFTEMKAKKAAGEYEKYTKKEQMEFDKEIGRLEKIVGGIEKLNKLPDIIYLVDIRNEQTALAEANRKKIKTVAICDTNVNPQKVNYAIPANDDATKSIDLITHLVCEAVKEGQKSTKHVEKPSVKKS